MTTPELESIEEHEVTEELESLEKENKGWKKKKVGARKQGHQATKNEVAEALKKFLASGGKIKKLSLNTCKKFDLNI